MPGPGSLAVGGQQASVLSEATDPQRVIFSLSLVFWCPLHQDANGCGLSFGEQEARVKHKEGIKEVGGLDQMSLRHAISSRKGPR